MRDYGFTVRKVLASDNFGSYDYQGDSDKGKWHGG